MDVKMEFVALLSSGKGTWGQVAGLVKRGQWEKVFLVCTEFAASKIKSFDFSQNAEVVSINFDKPILDVIEDIKKKLRDKFTGMEVSVSLASGEGKEHMALISALLNLPVGVKFVALTKDGIAEF
jgi:hypothetical protein